MKTAIKRYGIRFAKNQLWITLYYLFFRKPEAVRIYAPGHRTIEEFNWRHQRAPKYYV